MTAGPATGAHRLTVQALDRFDLPLSCGGVLVGLDDGGRDVSVQLFRGRPTQVALVTAAYVARLLVVRALATGATVTVATTRPQGWQPIPTSVPTGRAVLVTPGSPQPSGSTPGSPLLHCDDLGPGGAGTRTGLGPWQTRVAVQDFTPASAVPGLRTYDLVILQRVRPDLVHPLQTAFGLAPHLAQVLPRIPDEVVALLTPDRGMLVRLAPTEIERSLLGTPVRHEG